MRRFLLLLFAVLISSLGNVKAEKVPMAIFTWNDDYACVNYGSDYISLDSLLRIENPQGIAYVDTIGSLCMVTYWTSYTVTFTLAEDTLASTEDFTWLLLNKGVYYLRLDLSNGFNAPAFNANSGYLVSRIIVDKSFSTVRPTSIRRWFNGAHGIIATWMPEYPDYVNQDGLGLMRSISGLENLNTSEVTDMSNAFSGCDGLASLNLSGIDTHNVTNMEGMFSSNRTLTSLDLSNFDTHNVTNMASMFSNCSSLSSLDLSNFDTHNVTNMGGMFYACSALRHVDLSNFNTEEVTRMSYMFSRCTSLESLDLTSFNTKKVTNMSYMFGCEGWNSNNYNIHLSSILLGDFNNQNVIKMQCLFKGCSNLSQLDLSRFHTPKVLDMSEMFYDCSSLRDLDISGFANRDGAITSTRDMFYNCSELIKLNIGNFNLWVDSTSTEDREQDIYSYKNEEVFYGVGPCYLQVGEDFDQASLGQKNSSGLYSWGNGLFALDLLPVQQLTYDKSGNIKLTLLYADMSGLTSETKRYDQTDEQDSIVTLKMGSRSFDITKVSSVIVDSNFFDYHPSSTESWFSGFTNLSAIEGLNHLNTIETTSMFSMFRDCSSLTDIDISGFNTDSVNNAFYMFYGCNGLKKLNVGNLDFTNIAYKDDYVFYGIGTPDNPCTLLIGEKFDTSVLGNKIDNSYYKWMNGYFCEPTVVPTSITKARTDNSLISDSPVYTVTGQRVGDHYKGLVIVKGRKYIKK